MEVGGDDGFATRTSPFDTELDFDALDEIENSMLIGTQFFSGENDPTVGKVFNFNIFNCFN